MVKRTYGCSILVVAVLGGVSWLAYEEVNNRLLQFEIDAKSLAGSSEQEARRLLGDPDTQISYRDPERDIKLQELSTTYYGLEQRRIEDRALVYVKFRRCAILYLNKNGRITDVTYGEVE